MAVISLLFVFCVAEADDSARMVSAVVVPDENPDGRIDAVVEIDKAGLRAKQAVSSGAIAFGRVNGVRRPIFTGR